MAKSLRVLIIESSKYSADLNVRELTRGGFDVVWERVESEKAMREHLEKETWDVILSDHSTPMFNSIEALSVHNRLAAGTPFIIVSEDVSPEVLRYSMQNGCCAYLVRENLHQLAILVKKILENKKRGAAQVPARKPGERKVPNARGKTRKREQTEGRGKAGACDELYK